MDSCTGNILFKLIENGTDFDTLVNTKERDNHVVYITINHCSFILVKEKGFDHSLHSGHSWFG